MPTKAPQKPVALFTNKQWQQCYMDWLRSLHERSGSTDTGKSYRSVMRRFFTNPKRTPDTYTRPEVESYIRSNAQRGRQAATDPKPNTQNFRMRVLHSFYGFAAQYEVAYRNGKRPLLHTADPTRGIREVKPGRTHRALTEDELARLFAAIPRDTILGKRDYALLSCYFWSARRRQEITRLKWGDISGVEFIENGKPRAGHQYRFSTKGHSREIYTAELPKPAYEALIDYLQASGRYENIQPETPLFVRVHPLASGKETPLARNSADRIMKRYLGIAGLDASDKQICLHGLRHTRARETYKLRKDIREIQELLGHTSIANTMIYLVDVEDKPDAGAQMLYAHLGKL